MLPELLRVVVDTLGWGTYQASDQTITSHDGTKRILLLSGFKPAGLESATANAAWLDEWGLEDVPVRSWEAVQRRLSLAQGRALITTTAYCLGWLHQQIYKRFAGGDTDYDLISFRSIDNPAFPRAEWDRAERTLPDWKFRMQYCGEFTRPAGLIYSDYEDDYAIFEPETAPDGGHVPGPGRYVRGGNLVRAFSIPSTWLRSIGIDFGPVHCARLWIAEQPGADRYFVYRERLGGEMTYAEMAREVLEYKEPVKWALGGAKSESEQRAQWGLAGLGVAEPLISDLEAGIDQANGLFKQRRFFVFETCTYLRSDLATYQRELDDAGEPTHKIADKHSFHCLDALRYVASGYPLGPRKPREPDEMPPDTRQKGSLEARMRWAEPVETDEYL